MGGGSVAGRGKKPTHTPLRSISPTPLKHPHARKGVGNKVTCLISLFVLSKRVYCANGFLYLFLSFPVPQLGSWRKLESCLRSC